MERKTPGDNTESKPVLVIGSANMDLVVVCERFPRPGETLLGREFAMYPGGKGANQAVACAKLGGKAGFIGKLNRDLFGNRLLESLQRHGVDIGRVVIDGKCSTGIALITVDQAGQNEIVVVSGCNARLYPSDLANLDTLLTGAHLVLLQLEIPLETVLWTAERARAFGTMVVLNPAPAQSLSDSMLRSVDVLTPNETEAEILTGIPVSDPVSAEAAGRFLRAKGVRNVVVTLGAQGAVLVTAEGSRHVAARKVPTRDTTAAGDAFNGALAFALTEGLSIEKSVEFAVDVGTLAVTKVGAQPSMPTLGEYEAFAAESLFRRP